MNGFEGLVSFALVVFLLLIALALIVGVVVLVRTVVGERSGRGASLNPVRVLEERYARGEIDRDEFIQRREDLLG